MWLEDFSLDLDNWIDSSWDSWVNKAKEVASEKAQEQAKKSAAWIKRTQKDEKKAKKCDFLLASFLVKIIKDKKYDFLLEDLFSCLDINYPSNFLIWLLSLIYLPISDKIREKSKKPIIEFNYISKELIEFNDLKTPKEVQDRLNFWVEDIIDILSIEYSSLLTKRLKKMYWKDKYLLRLTSKIISFFFQEINITITASKAQKLSEFILKEVYKKILLIKIEEI
jgi:hypothetical protein